MVNENKQKRIEEGNYANMKGGMPPRNERNPTRGQGRGFGNRSGMGRIPNDPKCFQCPNVDHTWKTCTKIRCFNCWEYGHHRNNCTKPAQP
jgi:hypothetical protein